MNDIKIGTYNMQDFGLYLPEYTIPSPTPQTKFIDIIGRDGPVDLSNALGDIHFGARKWTLNFKCFDPTINWHTLTTNVMNAIHGKRLNFEFADDPNYFWTGRFNVVSYTPRNGEGTIRVDITSDPFKYTKLATIVQETVPKTTTYSGSVASFTATEDNGITSLTAAITPVQAGSGDPSPSNVRPITGYAGANIYVSPSQNQGDATTYTFDWTSAAGTVYGGTLDALTGKLKVTHVGIDMGSVDYTMNTTHRFAAFFPTGTNAMVDFSSFVDVPPIMCSAYKADKYNNVWTNMNDGICAYQIGTGEQKFGVVDHNYSDPTTFKESVTGQKIVYPLKTQKTFSITPQQVAALAGQNYIWSDTNGDVSVDLSEPILLTNNGRKPVVPTVTASAQMTLMWDNYTYTMNAGTSVIPQLVLDQGTTKIFVDGTGTIKFEYSEASL